MSRPTELFVGGTLDGTEHPPFEHDMLAVMHVTGETYTCDGSLSTAETRIWMIYTSSEPLPNVPEVMQLPADGKLFVLADVRRFMDMADLLKMPDTAIIRAELTWSGRVKRIRAVRDEKP